jgi:4Fe-4S ferredoxin
MAAKSSRFPKISKIVDDTQIKIEQKFLVKKYNLVLDRLKCVGCGQCSIVCPKDAILFGPAAAVYDSKPKDLNASVVDTIDPNKCVYCGTCQYFCPFDAIHVFEDGEIIEDEKLKIIENNALPKLESKKVRCSHIKRDAKVYWEGTIEVTYKVQADQTEFKQYYLNKCPGDCRKCEKICPTDAITFRSEADAWDSKVLIDIDDELCIKCGACALVCPQENYKVEWTKVITTGPYNDIFWSPIKEKLLSQKVRFTPEE